MRFLLPHDPDGRNLSEITWTFCNEIAAIIFCILWCWSRVEHPVWDPGHLKRILQRQLQGAHSNWNIGKPVSDVSIFRLDSESGNDLAFLILTGRQALTPQLQSIITPSSVCEEPPTACWGPARKLTWVNGLKENMRWQEAEMPFSSRATWKACIEKGRGC